MIVWNQLSDFSVLLNQSVQKTELTIGLQAGGYRHTANRVKTIACEHTEFVMSLKSYNWCVAHKAIVHALKVPEYELTKKISLPD